MGRCCKDEYAGAVDKYDDLLEECQWREEFLERMDFYIEAINNNCVLEEDTKNGWEWIHNKKNLSEQDAKNNNKLKSRISYLLDYKNIMKITKEDKERHWNVQIRQLLKRDKNSLLCIDACNIFEVGEYKCECKFCNSRECGACEEEKEIQKQNIADERARKKKEKRETFIKFMVFDIKLIWNKLNKVDRAIIIGTDDVLKQVALTVIKNKGKQIMIFVNNDDDIPDSITVNPQIRVVGRDKPVILNVRDKKKRKYFL
jgi:hypothetical protein